MSPLFAFRFDIIRGKILYDVLAIFVATPHLDSDALATTVETEIEENLVPDELFIVVRQPSFADGIKLLKTEPVNQSTLARLQGRTSVNIVSYDVRGNEYTREHIDGPKSRFKVTFDDFKRRAITHIFNNRRGFVESTPTYHFENPSGWHSERFIRLSNILARGAEIGFIGFCTLPLIPSKASTAYLDTPSLYAVVAALNEQRQSFSDTKPILADNFSSYSGLGGYQFNDGQDSFVLISASSSGGLASRLIQDGFEASHIAHLLFLGNDKSGSQIVCNLQYDATNNPEGVRDLPLVEAPTVCRLCAGGSIAIKLQGDQFEFAGPQPEALLIARNHAPPGLSDLIERTAGQGLYSVGLGKNYDRQIRQFHVSPEHLLTSDNFKQRLDYVLRRSLPRSLSHVIAIDEDSINLAKTVVEFGQSSAVVIRRQELDQIAKSTESAIAIVGAVIESGRSLLDVSRDLRSIAPNSPLLYIVGFSKSSGEQRRETLGQTLVQTINPYPYQFIEIERMILPVSTNDNAWSAELKLLSDPRTAKLVPDQLRPILDERKARLQKISEALKADLFIANAPGRNLELQPGFVFWPPKAYERSYNQADVFFTMASVLQRLRSNAHKIGERSAIRSNWFQQTILAPGNFGRFNDDVIQASLLRAAYPFEMNFGSVASDSRELGRLICRIIESSTTSRGGAAAEFLLAIATGRLRLCKTDRETVLATASGGSPVVDFLQEVCRSNPWQ